MWCLLDCTTFSVRNSLNRVIDMTVPAICKYGSFDTGIVSSNSDAACTVDGVTLIEWLRHSPSCMVWPRAVFVNTEVSVPEVFRGI